MSLRRDFISTAVTSGRARVLPSIWRSYVDCQRIAISNRTSTKPSATVLFADYAARAVNDVYSQRRTCLSRKPWKLHRAWRQQTVMQNLSKDPLLQYTRFDPKTQIAEPDNNGAFPNSMLPLWLIKPRSEGLQVSRCHLPQLQEKGTYRTSLPLQEKRYRQIYSKAHSPSELRGHQCSRA